MLSAVLRSDAAIKVSVAIMNAFVQMRNTIGNHQPLLRVVDKEKSFSKMILSPII